MSAAVPSLDQIKMSMRAAWMAGDFGQVARTIADEAERFIHRLALAPGTRVLDVACGTGNTALPLARAGCVVTGVDIAPNLLAQAHDRAQEAGLGIQFDEGDAESLPYEDASFDVVVSMFGAMFAPRPDLVVREFARVLVPGGRLAMANWNAGSFSGQMFKVNARHCPPPPGVPAPVLWGDDPTVRHRLGCSFRDIQTSHTPVDFDLPTSPAGAVAFFRKNFGPTQVAFSRLDAEAQAHFAADLEALWAGANVATDPDKHVLIHNEYLEVKAVRG
jgi:SAM-dependent methyltransferase